jgi:hypothetical protein
MLVILILNSLDMVIVTHQPEAKMPRAILFVLSIDELLYG